MQAIYGYDPAKWRLGTLCKHGHAWPGTQQSLRRIPSSKHPSVACCAACGNGGPYWLAGFIIGVKGGELPQGTRLSKPCKKHGHTYLDTGWCLRKGSKCVVCEPERIKLRTELERTDPDRKARKRAQSRSYTEQNREQINARRREQLAANPEQRQRRIDAKQVARDRLTEQGLTSRGTPPKPRLEPIPGYREAIRRAGSPCVADLVAAEQRAYWRKHPTLYQAYRNELYKWKYYVDPHFKSRLLNRKRLYMQSDRGKQKSKDWYLANRETLLAKARLRPKTYKPMTEASRAKLNAWKKANPEKRRERDRRRDALERAGRQRALVPATPRQVEARRALWRHRCAFCGVDAKHPRNHGHKRLTIEHVLALKNQGLDEADNLMPACSTCNSSKQHIPIETWYRSQPFFTEARWRKICRHCPAAAAGQMSLTIYVANAEPAPARYH